jgi:hypothetical protein
MLYIAVLAFAACADMLDINSNRNVSADDNKLNTANDKMHSVVGVLKSMQAAIERYIIVGELRGDLTDITHLTEADLQALSNYTATAANPYCSPTVFYTVINNANFFITHADTTVTEVVNGNLEFVLKQDYAVMKTFRAWAYLQLGILYGKASYFTEPLLTLEAIEKYAQEPQFQYDFPTLLEALYQDLITMPNVEYPDYGDMGGEMDFRNLCISKEYLLGEILLHLGSYKPEVYEAAARAYVQTLMENNRLAYPSGGIEYIEMSGSLVGARFLQGLFWINKYFTGVNGVTHRDIFSTLSPRELISGVQYSEAAGDPLNLLRMTQVPIASTSAFTYQMAPSRAAMNLFSNEIYTYYDPIEKEFTYRTEDLRGLASGGSSLVMMWSRVDGSMDVISLGAGSYRYSLVNASDSLPVISKFAAGFSTSNDAGKLLTFLYRRATAWLRLAEALNGSGRPSTAFAILKYGLNNRTLSDPTRVNPEEITPLPDYLSIFRDERADPSLGLHSRGAGDAGSDTLHYAFNDLTLQENRELGYYGFPEKLETKEDSILFVDAMIFKELALETAFEGNRYTDLLRFAERRSLRYGDDLFMAKWLARKNPALESHLANKNNWHLPLR